VLASSPGVGSGPISVAAADVNGDGSMDLISANLDASTLSVLTNNGVGRFVLAFSLDVGSGPESVAAADVNGDGRVDLISANSADSTLSVLTNNGVGGFVLAFTPDVGDGPRSVAAADVNGDGRVDLISANYYANTLSVLINNGPGGFVLASSPSVGIGPAAVAAADVNGDGRVDLISANWGGPFFHPPPPPPGTTLSVLFNAPAINGVFSGDGSELTSLSAGNIASGTLADVRLSTNVALLNADQSFTGKNTIAPPATLSFGSATRQMLNLYATDYGIGVQSSRLYFRSAFGAGFCWFLGGTHSDSSDNPGSGGTVAMSLNSAGLGIGTNAPAAQLHVVSMKASAAENGATFYAPNLGTEASHIQYGTDGDWYIRSSKTTGKVVLQDHGGNVGIGNGNPTDRLMVVNAHCDGNNWINSSDKNLKENFRPVDAKAILAKVAALPITIWNYKSDPSSEHLGPVAQDFHANFGLGRDCTSIATVDEGGVALAAIQGLNQKLEERDARIATLERELSELKQLVLKLSEKKHEN